MVQQLKIIQPQEDDVTNVGTDMVLGSQMRSMKPRLLVLTRKENFSPRCSSPSSRRSSISGYSDEVAFIEGITSQSIHEHLDNLPWTASDDTMVGLQQEETIDKLNPASCPTQDIQPTTLSLVTDDWWYNLPPELQQVTADEAGPSNPTARRCVLGYPFTVMTTEETYGKPRQIYSPEMIREYTGTDSYSSHNDSSRRRWSYRPRFSSEDSMESDIISVNGDDQMKLQLYSNLDEEEEVGPEGIETDSGDCNRCQKEQLLTDLSMLLPHSLHSALYSSKQWQQGNFVTRDNREVVHEILDTDKDKPIATEREKATRHLDSQPMRRAPNGTWLPVNSCRYSTARDEIETNADEGAGDRRARTLPLSDNFKPMRRAPQSKFMASAGGSTPRGRFEIEANSGFFARKRTFAFCDFCASKKASDVTSNTVEETEVVLACVDNLTQLIDDDDAILQPP